MLQTNNKQQSLFQPNDDIESRSLYFTAASNLYSELVISDKEEDISKRCYEAGFEIQRYQRSLADSNSQRRTNNLHSGINVRFAVNSRW